MKPKWLPRKCAEPGILIICVLEFFSAALQVASFSLAKVSQCAKVILRRRAFRHVKREAIIPPRRLGTR